MGFTLAQAATSLQVMDTSGTLTTLTLPAGIKLDSTLRPRFAIFGRYIVVVNSPTRPLLVDPDGNVRLLAPRPPRSKPAVSASSGGTLTGAYKVKQSFRVLDSDGNLIAESALGPASDSVTLATQWLTVSNVETSSEQVTIDGSLVNYVTSSRLYRTAAGGTEYFPWLDTDGNVVQTLQDDLADASLQTISAPTLGSVPDLSMVAEFRSRLWGVTKTDIDVLRFSTASKAYSWPAVNGLVIPRDGSDDRGITGLIVRREAIGVGRLNSLHQIVGDDSTDFRPVKISADTGVNSPGGPGVAATDSVAVYRDTAFFLWNDGVYTWDDNGIACVSDGKVRSWFTTDTYFNRARFRYAVGRIDPLRGRYLLLLSAAGSSNLDRWVEYDINDKTWWGPHKTDEFTPTWVTTILDSNGLALPVMGSSSGFLYKEQDTRTDGTSTAIAFDVDTKFHDANTPKITKQFGNLDVVSKKQSAGTLQITPYVGELNAPAATPILADMTLPSQMLRRIGTGNMVKLNFYHATAGQDVELYGYEIPFYELGNRT